jgi:hypothetical protein
MEKTPALGKFRAAGGFSDLLDLGLPSFAMSSIAKGFWTLCAAAIAVHRPLPSPLLSCLIGVFLALPGASQGAEAGALQFPNIRKQFDRRNEVIWYIPESGPTVVDAPAFYVYFGEGEKRKLTPLRLKVVYRGKQALRIQRYWATADGKPLRSFPNAKWNMQQILNVWEWIDEPLPEPLQLHELATLASAEVAVIHFEGAAGKHATTLSVAQKQAIRDVIKAYETSSLGS